MQDTQATIREMYTAFNSRDIDGALTLMSDTINWPKASEGGRVIGKAEIRAYWTRQWAEFNPIVQPLSIVEPDPGTLNVEVHQLVKSLTGKVISDQIVLHRYTFANGLIARMDITQDQPAFDRRPH